MDMFLTSDDLWLEESFLHFATVSVLVLTVKPRYHYENGIILQDFFFCSFQICVCFGCRFFCNITNICFLNLVYLTYFFLFTITLNGLEIKQAVYCALLLHGLLYHSFVQHIMSNLPLSSCNIQGVPNAVYRLGGRQKTSLEIIITQKSMGGKVTLAEQSDTESVRPQHSIQCKTIYYTKNNNK